MTVEPAPPLQPAAVDRLLAFYGRRRWRGFISLRRLLRRPTLTIRTRYGAVCTLNPGDYIDQIVLQDGYYESEIIEALRPYFHPEAVLWDIGANFGLHSLSAARIEPRLQIHAFEPNPVMFDRLAAHATGNRAEIRCWPVALGETDGRATLHINNRGNPGMTTVTPWSEATYDSHADVDLRRGDSLVQAGRVPPPTVIKLDVEGSEPAVLTGLGGLLQRDTLQAIVFESRADLLADPARCPAARQLVAAGFTLRPLDRAEASGHDLGNFLACRSA